MGMFGMIAKWKTSTASVERCQLDTCNTKKAKRAREAPENYTHRISLRRKKNMYGLINMHTTKINIPRAQLYSCQYSIA